ncbi:hypothetical protein OK006_10203 [Actinobacteria bacterium OK006]|nr:hypothetical protein OK006_10203 [Actinobacteria bacterium OK006]
MTPTPGDRYRGSVRNIARQAATRTERGITVSSHDWSIDTIVHALPSPTMRQQCLREVHLAPLDDLESVVDRWRDVATQWVNSEAPRVDAARAEFEATGSLSAEYEETAESADRFDAWRQQMQGLRQQRGAA